MIFGFNTDIKHDNTVYHVQSEARQSEQLLQTQVFVRGRCIGKHAHSYSEQLSRADFSDQHMHELLKAQHRRVIEAIREGKIEELLGSAQPADAVPAAAASTSPESQFTLEFLNPDAIASDGMFILRFRVAENSSGVDGAKLVSKLSSPAIAQPIYSQSVTSADGTGELRIALANSDSMEASVLVQATRDGRTATRKFVLRSMKS